MKKTFLFVFVLSTSLTIAQIPGYMGKRLSLGYSTYVSPRTSVLDELSDINIGSGGIASNRAFNMTHCLGADYIISPRISLCLAAQFSKTDLFKYGTIFDVTESMGGSRDYYKIVYRPEDEKDMALRGMNISFGFKFFKSRYLNPYGRYRKIELILAQSAVVMDKDGFYYDYSNQWPYYTNKKYELEDRSYNYKSFVVAFTFGKQRILFNKLILDYGVRAGINYNYVFKHASIIGMLSEGFSDDYTIAGKLKEAANFRLFGAQLFNAHIGLGFLAF